MNWAKSNEKQPENEGEYLVVHSVGGITIAHFRDGRWKDVCSGKTGIDLNVTHWMPLPSRPE